MTDFKDYIDFKRDNPYAEKDMDFEREETPLLKNRPPLLEYLFHSMLPPPSDNSI
jgi:hypothetical protein